MRLACQIVAPRTLHKPNKPCRKQTSVNALKFWEIAAQLNPEMTEVQATWQAVQQLPTIAALMSEAGIAEGAGQIEEAETHPARGDCFVPSMGALPKQPMPGFNKA